MGVDGWVNVKKWAYGRIVALYGVVIGCGWSGGGGYGCKGIG